VESYFDPPRGRRKQIGYGGSYFDSESPVAGTALSPEERESLLDKVAGRTLQGAELLFDVLDAPASLVRDTIAGQSLGSGTTTGKMLAELGLRPSSEALGGWGRPLAEFAAGALTDPTTYVGPGLTRGAEALRGAGLLDDATRVMSKKLIQDGDLGSKYTQNALDSWWENFGRGWKSPGVRPSASEIANDLTDADLLARPLAGTVTSRRNLTVKDIIEAQADPAAATKKVDDWLGRYKQNYDQVKDSPLRYDIGIGLPLSDYVQTGMNLGPFGETIARNIDKAGQALRWSAPVRYGYAAFDRSAAGSPKESVQIIGKELTNALKAGESAGRFKASQHLQDLDPSVFGDNEVGRAMRRVLEGRPSPEDLKMISSRSDLQRFVDMWHGQGAYAALKTGSNFVPTQPGLAAEYLSKRAQAGLGSEELQDPFKTMYFPRHVDDMSFWQKITEEGSGKSSGGKSFSAMTGDQMARKDPLKSPGGTDVLNKLSLDPQVAGPDRLLSSDLEAARYIKKVMDGESAKLFPAGTGPEYTMKQASLLARTLRQLDQKSLDAGMPLFGSSFVDDFTRSVVGNERALAVASTMEDFLAKSAKLQNYKTVTDKNVHVSMGKALKDLDLFTLPQTKLPVQVQMGAKTQIANRLASRFPAEDIKLRNVSVDKRVVSAMAKIADFYKYPEVQRDWLAFFDRFTAMWKTTILAWPASKNRDWYAAGFTNLVELGSGRDTMAGYSSAKDLIQGNWEKLDEHLATWPKYKGMAPDERKRAYISDIAAAGVTSGRRQSDLAGRATALQGGVNVADELLPGWNPRTTTGYAAWDKLTGNTLPKPAEHAVSELTKNWDKFGELGLQDSTNIGNPFLRWSAKSGDITDQINRMALFNGLLRQGVDPMEAGKRVLTAHVDYDSLTTLEKNFFRRLIPFWSYTSRTSKWVAKQIMDHPGGRYTQLGMRLPEAVLHSEEEEYVPESIRGSYGTPVEGRLSRPFGGVKEGVTPWLTDIDLPGIDQINMIKPGFQRDGTPSIAGTAWNTGTDAVGKLAHPLLKEIAQTVTGENFYTKRPLKDMETVSQTLAEDLIGVHPQSAWGQTIKNLDPVLNLLPFAPRTLQITNRLLDDEKLPDFRDRLWQMGINATSGVKFQNVDDQARRIDARKKIAEMMQADPLVRNFTQTFIPEDSKPFVDNELLELMALERQLGKELARERELRSGVISTKKRRTDPQSYFE
jgi:hypothetical protein